jgi:UDP-N-acetylglucosamine 1-carboxyvinyltransferase
MDRLKIKKSRLVGKVKVSGAKNSTLKLLTASILTNENVKINNYPSGLLDAQIHVGMLEALGKKCIVKDDCIEIIEVAKLNSTLAWNKRSIRNTLLILGALLTRTGKGAVPLPGGCKLGERKYDLHVMIFEKMGAKVWEDDKMLYAETNKRLKGTDVFLPIRSTGATENAIICGTLAIGKTTVWNPHIRPEIMDLISMLKSMGAKIEVFGQQCIEIEGVEGLTGTKHTVIPDNMEAITWAIASVITNGDVEIINFPFDHLEVPLIFLKESGMKYYKGEGSLIVKGGTPYPIDISTGPYPGINSDMQPLFAVYGALSKGTSKIVDLRFIGRYNYTEELAKMGLKYKVDNNILTIRGGYPLHGATVKALDLRAGMSLILAGLVAEGETIIEDAWQIKRGYENLNKKLNNLLY